MTPVGRKQLDVTAVILCGGKGERLRPFTESLPKPLVPLRDKPLLEHLLGYLFAQGVQRFVLCIGYKGDAIRQFVADRAPPEWDVHCVDSGDVSMTDRILDARALIPGAALICYGDTLANVDLGALESAHRQRGAIATLSVHPLHSPFGIVDFDDEKRVVRFTEKPQLPYWLNIGFLWCEPTALDFASRGSDMVAFLQTMSAAGALRAYEHTGRHLTVNTEKERLEAEANLVAFYTAANE